MLRYLSAILSRMFDIDKCDVIYVVIYINDVTSYKLPFRSGQIKLFSQVDISS